MRPPDRGTLPAGYPVSFERQVRLRDGRSVHVRPILPSDAAALGAAIRDSDPDTLRRRFLGTPPRFTPAMLAWLTTVDYVLRFALVAFDPVTEEGVAVARYEPLEEEATAEIAVAVVPAWRRAGLATALFVLLAEAGIERGVRFFGASYLAGNRPVEAMLAHTRTGARRLLAQGVAELAVTLDDERPS